MADRDGRIERLGDLLADTIASLRAGTTNTHHGDPPMTLTENALRSPVPSAEPRTPLASRQPAHGATRPQEAASGSVVDNWLCDRCDRARDLNAGIGCPCSTAPRGRGRR